jgi:Asp-tRNA(Asn)/Glu-tRNA(Gln) amidotransferase A subunit family amidase
MSAVRGSTVAFACASLLAGAFAPVTAQTPAIDVVELTAAQIQADYAARKYTAVQLTRAFLDRINRYEDHYNAFITMNPNALSFAAELDAEYQRTGRLRGPLHGVPVVIKDNIDYGGLLTTAGYEGFSKATGGVDMIPDDDAAAVSRLRAAGAIILGKTNMPDFAGNGTHSKSTVAGVTLNPYALDRAPGGSSGGTATAVNGSFAVLGLGTETGGSIQNPAASQALVGIKPTFGLVPLEGVVPIDATYRDVVGPLAKTVRDAAVTLDIIAGPTNEDLATYAAVGRIPEGGYVAGLSETSLQGKRFGLLGPGWRTSNMPMAPETEAAYRRAVEVLKAQGAEVVEDPFLNSGWTEQYGSSRGGANVGAHDMLVYMMGLGEGAAFHSPEEWEALTGRPFRGGGGGGGGGGGRGGGGGDPGAAAGGRAGGAGAGGGAAGGGRGGGGGGGGGGAARRPVAVTATEEGDAFGAWRMATRALYRKVLADHDLDGLFFPQASAPIRKLVEDPARPDYTPNNHPEIPSNIINDIGVPVVTVPFSYYEDGTPFVITFIGDLWTDAALISYAYDFEQATKARRPPRLVPKP